MHPDFTKETLELRTKFYLTIEKKLTDVDEEFEDKSIMSMLFEFYSYEDAVEFMNNFRKNEISGYKYIFTIEED